jgi:HAD superfamily hydrolase (TIGR01490 family)
MKSEVNEVEEVKEVQEKSAVGAGFFDIDGTMLARPSLERRFFWELQRRGKIPARNYLHWLAQTLQMTQTLRRRLRDLRAAVQTNKSYLRGVRAEIPFSANGDYGSARAESWLAEFFPAAIQRLWWHALRGDAIVLVSGTLAPLAEIVQFALERELLWRGVECKISIIATKLEIADGCWTGGVAGAAILGEEKASAVKEFARAQNISLARCSAYGDSSLDRWMLAAVGHAFAVNPTWRLRRIARSHGWQILHWTHCAKRTASEQRAASEQRSASEERAAIEQHGEQHGMKKSLKLKREAAR